MPYEVSLTVDPAQSEFEESYALVETGEQSALARGLGWFSIGLGLSELFAPRQLSRAIGVRDTHPALLPLLGVRELVSGVGILARRDQTRGWLKARVVGDLIDLSLLAAAFIAPRRDVNRLAVAAAAVAGVTALDIACAARA